MAKDEILSVEEAAAILGLKGRIVRKYLLEDRLHGKLLGRQWAVLRSEVERFKAQREAEQEEQNK